MARRYPIAAISFACLAFALLMSAGVAFAETVPQPIAFSHKNHVTVYKMNCRFCHSSANKSQYANLPSVEKCMMCHRSIATDRPEVKKVAQYWNEKKPIPWNKVIDVPNHVYFPHKKMVNAGIAVPHLPPGDGPGGDGGAETRVRNGDVHGVPPEEEGHDRLLEVPLLNAGSGCSIDGNS